MNIQNFIKENSGLNVKPYKKKKNPCIYFICDTISEEIIYIGQSEHLDTRISAHEQDKRFKNSFFYYFECPENLLQKESILIRQIKPKFNLNGIKEIKPKFNSNGNKKPRSKYIKFATKSSMQLNIKKIERELKRLGWNKSRLGREMGMSKQAIHYYFKSNVTLMKVEKLAKALNLDARDLLI